LRQAPARRGAAVPRDQARPDWRDGLLRQSPDRTQPCEGIGQRVPL